MPSYALLIVHGDSTYRPNYVYTWSDALAAGAGGGGNGTIAPRVQRASASASALTIIRLRVRGRTITFHIRAPGGAQVSCSLTRAGLRERYVPCDAIMIYRGLRPGRYRLAVRAAGSTVARRVRIR
jgi:hypothetical protein